MKHALALSLLYNIETDGKVIHHQTFLEDFSFFLLSDSDSFHDQQNFQNTLISKLDKTSIYGMRECIKTDPNVMILEALMFTAGKWYFVCFFPHFIHV